MPVALKSLSLRRAWIEIGRAAGDAHADARRSPYGERGLKYAVQTQMGITGTVALLTESVD